MPASRPLALLAALLLGACPNPAVSSRDAALAPADAQSVATVDAGSLPGDAALLPPDAGVADAASGAADAGLVWPNAEHGANSDPWIAEHHAEIRLMRPRVLALNFVNAKTNEQMIADLQRIFDVVAESSRYHGYADASAQPFLVYELFQAIDLRDATPPAGWPYHNSTLYPRQDPVQGYWGFDYGKLFGQAFADQMKIPDPLDTSRNLRLCQLIARGMINEVWIYGDADVPDASAAEILELKPAYDANRVRLPGQMDPCAGNGCFDDEDVLAASECTRTVRIGWVNNTRGPGCFMESLSHGFESIGNSSTLLPTLHAFFPVFAGFDLDTRYGLPFSSWYVCPYGVPCLSYPTQTSVAYQVSAAVQGTVSPYDPVCGNVHWALNATAQYDLLSTATVQSTCETYRFASTEARPFSRAQFAPYRALANDCQGPWLVWWRQNWPGLDSRSLDDLGRPMLNWWPFIYY